MPPGNKDFSLSPEITRLSAILARDPNSKLFIALAEEYMKAGMADEAVMTLEKGLTANPYYMSARVMLGKAYLETGDEDKAREQFETVVKSVPDNLLAHKKLGEIYRRQGRTAEAARSFKMVTLLNPKDEEAARLLKELEKSASAPAASGARGPSEGMDFESHMQGAAAGRESPQPASYHTQTFDFTEPLETGPEPEADNSPMYELDAEPEVIEMPVPEGMATLADIPYAVEAEPAEEPEAGVAPEAPAQVEAPSVEPSGYGLTHRGELADILASYMDAASGEEAEPAADSAYEIEGEISGFELDGVKIEPIEPAKKEPFETETLAELYISQGFYDRAISIYKNLLMERPDDAALKEKLEGLYKLAAVNPAQAVEFEEPEVAEVFDEAGAGEPGIDEGAVRRLEQFLENIRRKAGR